MPSNPNPKTDAMRERIFAGARLELGRLSKEELEALHPLLTRGDVEIISENCRPVAVRKLKRW